MRPHTRALRASAIELGLELTILANHDLLHLILPRLGPADVGALRLACRETRRACTAVVTGLLSVLERAAQLYVTPHYQPALDLVASNESKLQWLLLHPALGLSVDSSRFVEVLSAAYHLLMDRLSRIRKFVLSCRLQKVLHNIRSGSFAELSSPLELYEEQYLRGLSCKFNYLVADDTVFKEHEEELRALRSGIPVSPRRLRSRTAAARCIK